MSATTALKAAAKGDIPVEKARDPYQHLKHQLENSRGEFAKLVGSPANAEKFIRVVLNAVLANPELLDASRASLVGACMKAAQDGLLPDGREAVLNIYNTKVKVTVPGARGGQRTEERWEKRAQYLPMVGGLVKKLYASGEVVSVDAAVVYVGDVFRFVRGDDPHIEHEVTGDYGETPELRCVYCVVKLKNGEKKREVMWMHDIAKVRAASKAADSGPWKTWFEEMAIKSVIKRIYKQLPHSDAFEALAQYDNEATGYAGAQAESAAAIAERTLQEQQPEGGQPALEHQPGEVLEPNLSSEQRELVRELSEANAPAEARMEAAIAAEKAQPGVTPKSEQELATSVEVAMRAAKTEDALDLAAERGRAIKDEALKLRLNELYEHEHKRFEPKE